MAAAGARRRMITSATYSQSGRLIPKRGQVKMAIVMGLAQSVASIFSFRSRRGGMCP